MQRNVWVKLGMVSLAGVVLSLTLLWGVGQFNSYYGFNRNQYGMNYMYNGNMYNGNMNMQGGMNVNGAGNMNMQGGMGMMGGMMNMNGSANMNGGMMMDKMDMGGMM